MKTGNHQINNSYFQNYYTGWAIISQDWTDNLSHRYFPHKLHHINQTWFIISIYKTRSRWELGQLKMLVVENATPTIMRYHCPHIGMTKIQNTNKTKCWQRCWATGTLTDY